MMTSMTDVTHDGSHQGLHADSRNVQIGESTLKEWL